MEKLIKTIEIFDREIKLYKQGMWLIASENNVETERIELFGKSTEEGISSLIDIVTEKMVSMTFEVNLLPYQRIMDRNEGKINLERRRESFNDWKEILHENNTITKEQQENFEYVGKEEMI